MTAPARARTDERTPLRRVVIGMRDHEPSGCHGEHRDVTTHRVMVKGGLLVDEV